MTKYMLTDGSIVEAEKDCECMFHEEPHWLYEDRIWKDRNTFMLDDMNFRGYAKEEEMRLMYKSWFMKTHNIQEIFSDL